MSKLLMAILSVLALSAVASAQQPMSPPERAPVPLKVEDPKAASKDAKTPEAPRTAPKPGEATKVLVPAEMAGHHISSGNGALDALVQDAAARFALDPCLIISVMRAESGFNRLAVSPKGASGLMQLIPATAARFGVRNIFDPRENILGGSAYLRWLLERFDGDVRLALAGYNAGEGAVEVYGNRIPPFLETQNYVRTIYSRYSTLHQGRVAQQPAQAARPAILRAPPPQPGEAFPTYNQVIRFTSSNGDKSGK